MEITGRASSVHRDSLTARQYASRRRETIGDSGSVTPSKLIAGTNPRELSVENTPSVVARWEGETLNSVVGNPNRCASFKTTARVMPPRAPTASGGVQIV